jgi:hypothetical protein
VLIWFARGREPAAAINGVMVTGFMDASARLIPPTITQTVWLNLVEPRDGSTVDTDAF